MNYSMVIGDLVVTCFAVQSLVRGEPETYTVLFHDGPSGESFPIVCSHETAALDLLADWLKCDDDEAAYERCVALGLRHPFLP